MITQIANYSLYYDSSRPYIFKFGSTDPNTINIVYVLEIENPSTLAWEERTLQLKQPIEWGVSEWWIDPSELTTDFVEWGIVQDPSVFIKNWEYKGNHRIKCRFKMTEELLNPTTGELTYDDDTSTWQTSYMWWAIDACTTHEETFEEAQYEWLYDYYLAAHNWSGAKKGTCKMLTQQPLVTTECRGDNKYMSFASELIKDGVWLGVDIVREDGTVHSNVQMSDVLGLVGVTQFGIGAPQLQQYLSSQGTLNTYWLDTNRWASITWRWVQGELASDYLTADYTTNFIDCGCEDEHIRLWWRNDKNGIDSYTFKGTHQVKLKTENRIYQRPLGHRRLQHEDTTSNPYQLHNTFNQQSIGTSKINIKTHKKMKIWSGWEKGEMLEWLADIISSTDVFVEDRNAIKNLRTPAKLTPVIIKSPEFFMKNRNNKLGKMELDLYYANPRTTMRR